MMVEGQGGKKMRELKHIRTGKDCTGWKDVRMLERNMLTITLPYLA